MATTKSAAVRARQAAMDKLLAAQRETIERTADAAVEAQVAHAQVADLTGELECARDRFAVAVGALVELGQSHEQIAELCELDVSAVRSARRAKPAAEPAEVHTLPPLAPAASEGAA